MEVRTIHCACAIAESLPDDVAISQIREFFDPDHVEGDRYHYAYAIGDPNHDRFPIPVLEENTIYITNQGCAIGRGRVLEEMGLSGNLMVGPVSERKGNA
jgi:hypothetical protein